MLLEAASIEDAQVWAERFRQDVAATALVCGEVSISYSASMGVAPISANLRVEPSEECDASVPR
ncbi:hypothetical protein CIG70_00020, partial [Escherichia coli]